MLEVDDYRFTITDLKQYIYCPRIFYYHTCLPGVRPITYKMEAGIRVHRDEPKRASRRNPTGEEILERHFDVALQSDTLGLSGKVDEVVRTPTGWRPVDYKLTRIATAILAPTIWRLVGGLSITS